MRCWTLLGSLILFAPSFSHAAAGEWGIGGAAGAAFPIAPSSAREAGSVRQALGVHVSYAPTENLNTEISYDNVSVGEGGRSEPIILSGVWHAKVAEGIEPFLQLGLGAGRTAAQGAFNNLAAKAGLGLVYHCGPISWGPQVIYHYVGDQGSSMRSLHTLTPGLYASYHFKLLQTQS